ncbi:50S ribosomal protein L19 [Patescibacteria group bacterium]|nr:50S ribosomal protein L19 [Patescibacteria group bacterium]
MAQEIKTFLKSFLKKDLPKIKPGDTVKVYQKIKEILKKGKKSKGKVKEEGKERVQIFEGIVLAKKHGQGVNSAVTVRKIIAGCGVEKTFLLHSPSIEKIKIITPAKKVRRANLYYLRGKTKK